MMLFKWEVHFVQRKVQRLRHLLLRRILLFGISLGSHDPLHVSWPAIGASHQGTGRFCQSVRDCSLADLLLQRVKFLQPFCQRFVFFVQSLLALLGLLRVINCQSFFGNVLEFLAFKLGERLDAVFINRLHKEEDFVALLQKAFHKWRFLNLKTRRQYETSTDTFKSRWVSNILCKDLFSSLISYFVL